MNTIYQFAGPDACIVVVPSTAVRTRSAIANAWASVSAILATTWRSRRGGSETGLVSVKVSAAMPSLCMTKAHSVAQTVGADESTSGGGFLGSGAFIITPHGCYRHDDSGAVELQQVAA